jgi:predicted phage terminase large subunit-like protein
MEALLYPDTVRTAALRRIAEELERAYRTPGARLIISMPPQEGKTSLSRASIARHLAIHPSTRVVFGSYALSLARKHGRAVRDAVRAHPELGLRIRRTHDQMTDWAIDHSGGGVLSVGTTGGLSGAPADLLVIDDPIKDAVAADSEDQRENLWDWWTKVALARLAPGAPVVLIMTRWHEDDLVGRILAAPDAARWRVLNISALAGDDDPLGRAPGQWLVSARGRTVAEWEAIRVQAGVRAFEALYQGAPTAAGGVVFPASGWLTWDELPITIRADGTHHLEGCTGMLQSWDMTFDDTAGADYVVGQTWAQIGMRAYLVDQYRERADYPATRAAVIATRRKWPQTGPVLVEKAANGAAILSSLRQVIPGLLPVSPTRSKVVRARAVAPFVEAHNVVLPSVAARSWAHALRAELDRFPGVAHDDQTDALSQALARIYLLGSDA